MKEQVIIIPADSLVAVNGEGLHFSFAAPASVHAIQWHGGAGHIEYVNASLPNKPLSGADDYAAHVAPYVALWEAEKARREAEANRPLTEEEQNAKARQDILALLAAIDEKYLTSRVLAGLATGDEYSLEQYRLHEEEAEPWRDRLAAIPAASAADAGGEA